MLLRALQSLLADLYGIEVDADVRDFVVTDAAALRPARAAANARDTAEQLLIGEGDGELCLALYLDPDLLHRLDAFDPLRCLCACNIEDFCTVLEGVSHFNYVAWNAACDKPVTLLELEMQAEVDKYVSARALLGRQAGGDIGRRLLAHLFGQPAFDPALPAEELRRYHDASRFASAYCASLESRFPAGAPGPGMLRELRAFFRWPQPAKVSHIRSSLLS
ncbi:MAG: hypothetical protein AMXMBFR8_29710 [Nevskiales bacterium]